MKKITTAILIVFCFFLLGCSSSNTVPKSSADYVGTQFEDTKSELQTAGFTDFEEVVIDDLTSDSSMADGTIESLTIGEKKEVFEAKEKFPKDSKVYITYHIIPRAKSPISSSEIQKYEYVEIAKKFENNGFTNVKTKEVYDLDPDQIESDHINEVRIDGKDNFEKDGDYIFDAEIDIVCHLKYTKYSMKIDVDFVPNLIFSKYDVDYYIDGNILGTLKHGEDVQFEVRLPEGEHMLSFTKHSSSTPKGDEVIALTSDAEAKYKISCYSDEIKVSKEYIDYKTELGEDQVKTMSSQSAFVGRNHSDVVKELKELGFTNIKETPKYDIILGITEEGSVDTVFIDGSKEYRRGDIFKKNCSVEVVYHLKYEDDPANQETANESSGEKEESSASSGDKEESKEEAPKESIAGDEHKNTPLYNASAKDVYAKICKRLGNPEKEDFEAIEYYIYNADTNKYSVEVDANKKKDKIYIISILPWGDNYEEKLYLDILAMIFEGDDLSKANEWFKKNKNKDDARTKIGDANLLISQNTSNKTILYIVSDDYIDWY